MCGIAGVISLNPSLVSADRLQHMTDSIAHRGPEGGSWYINSSGQVGFGHRRLSIIDASDAAMQPMHYLERYLIVYNGEIYNYLELRSFLQGIGYAFRSESDTEVILAAFDHYREKCVDHFDGMFAFSIWDEAEQTLYCARDRFGEKPFYYFFDEGTRTFYFASEMKALRAAGLDYSLNNGLLLQYLTLGYTSDTADASATFDGRFKKLPAAHQLQFSPHKGGITISRYWVLSKENICIDPDEAIDRFNELLSVSVERRLRSDVSLGASLSGGLDSSSIVDRIMQIQPGRILKTFTASFPGFSLDESQDAALVAAHLGVENHTTSPNGYQFVQDFDKLVRHQEEPFSSASVYAQYRVFELARQHKVTVILDGQGADEILAGYNKYIHWFLQELLSRSGSAAVKRERSLLQRNKIPFNWSVRNRVSAILPRYTSRLLEKREMNKAGKDELIHKDFLHSCFSSVSIHKPVVKTLNDILHFNTCEYGLEDLLRYADRNAMAHGREVRLPFLNHELVSFVFSLPAGLKIHHGWTKWLLRRSVESRLPPEIAWKRSKIGFEPPQQQWMQQAELAEYHHEAIKKLVKERILDRVALKLPLKPHSAYTADNAAWRYLIAGSLVNNRSER